MATQRNKRACKWCGYSLSGTNRKFCSPECKESAMEAKTRNPTPEEIRAMCEQIRREGGERWETARCCYSSRPVEAPTVKVITSDFRSSL